MLRKEIDLIGRQLAITSDATKDKNITEDKFSELKKEIEKLENKKEELTQKLSYFDPAIAAQFRTSTPINQESPMEIEDNLRRKRTATSPELNRSFSESDLSQTAKKLKDGSITSFLTSAPKYQQKTGEEGFNQAQNSRRNLNQINSQPQSRKSSITSTKTPKKLKTKPRQEDTQIIPPTKTEDDLEKTSTQNNQQQNVQLTNSTKKPNQTGNPAHSNSSENSNNEKIWERFKKEQTFKKSNITKQDFELIINFYLKYQEIDPQTTKTEQNTIIKEIQSIKSSNANTQERVDKTLKQIEEVKTLLTKNAQKLEHRINEVDKTVHSLERNQKIEETKEKSSWGVVK
ncbi:unnamed protein product [Bemisia tabaci]|uniref:Uncharacterized protein n=1 Tax=Bemisia tabaci TaxID=7038 RepID=A0AAI8Y399_BEMTA|nr:unnamed protein product [Bemisia tabaci]